MRVDIKTNGPVRDKEIRSLYVLNAGMQIGSERMREHNLQYIADKYGFMLVKK